MSEVDRLIWRDGEFIPWGEATVHVLSQSLQRGSLAFDYMSVHQTASGPVVFRLTDHVNRLFETCRIMGIPIGHRPDALINACVATVMRNPGATSLKISALIPSIEVELVPQDPSVSVFIAAYDSRADVIDRHPGTYVERRLLKLRIERNIANRREDIIPAQAKVAANYTSPMFAKWRARQDGFDDILLLDANERVAEAPTANLFAVVGGELLTPPTQSVLLGITRASIIELGRALGMTCREQDINVAQLLAADEVFLTATSVGVWPVVQIDEVRYSNGKIGPVTGRLQQKYKSVVAGEAPDFAHWLTICH